MSINAVVTIPEGTEEDWAEMIENTRWTREQGAIEHDHQLRGRYSTALPHCLTRTAYAGPRTSARKRRTIAGSRRTWTWARGRCAAIAGRSPGRLRRR